MCNLYPFTLILSPMGRGNLLDTILFFERKIYLLPSTLWDLPAGKGANNLPLPLGERIGVRGNSKGRK